MSSWPGKDVARAVIKSSREQLRWISFPPSWILTGAAWLDSLDSTNVQAEMFMTWGTCNLGVNLVNLACWNSSRVEIPVFWRLLEIENPRPTESRDIITMEVKDYAGHLQMFLNRYRTYPKRTISMKLPLTSYLPSPPVAQVLKNWKPWWGEVRSHSVENYLDLYQLLRVSRWGIWMK